MRTDGKRQNADRVILTGYLLGFLALALTVALRHPLADTPPQYANPPDEHARYLVPQFICRYGRIPTGMEEEIRIPGYGFSYGLYNVFPYIVQGYVMRFVRLFTDSELGLLYAARLVNVTFGVLMAAVVYLLGRRLFSDRRFRWLFCFGVMYLPQSIFIHTYVNTDSCCMLATAMMLYGIVCLYQDGISWKNSLWMSGGIILCALSYYNAYGYILSCILLFAAYFFRREKGGLRCRWKPMLRWGCLISAIVLLGIGWWFIRSYIVLDGDFLGLATREKMRDLFGVGKEDLKTYQSMGLSVWYMLRERNTLEGAFYSFVAAYGSMSIYAGPWLYRLYKLFFGAGALGCLSYLCQRKGRARMSGRRLFFHANMIFCILMPFVLMVYYAYTMDYQHQGRYLLPGLIPLMYYAVRGIEELSLLRIGKFSLPNWGANLGIVFCYLIIIAGTLDMILLRAVPVYMETGMVLT